VIEDNDTFVRAGSGLGIGGLFLVFPSLENYLYTIGIPLFTVSALSLLNGIGYLLYIKDKSFENMKFSAIGLLNNYYYGGQKNE